MSGRFDPLRHRAIWPSTGNYCRGGAAKAYKTLKREMIEHEKKFVDRYTEAERKQLVSLLQRLHA